jgi:flagellar hook protein FlgE
MLSSLYSGISGLLANSDALDVISNNISNVNTVGYKSQAAQFEDLLYQTIVGASGTSQVGRGSALESVNTDFSQGSFETTNSSTDLAIGGQGFFIVRKQGEQTDYYTRAGNFSLDTNGNLIDSGGDYVQGKAIDQATGTAAGVDGNIVISQQPSEPKPSSTIDMVVNLDSSSAWAGSSSITSGSLVTNIAAASGEYPATGDYSLTVTGAATDGAYPVALTMPDGTTVYGTATSAGTVSDFTGNTAPDGSGTAVDTGLALTFGTLSYSPTFSESGTVTAAAAATGDSPGAGAYTITVTGAATSGSYPISILMPDGTTIYSTASNGSVSDLTGNTAPDGSGSTVNTGLALTFSGLSWNSSTSTGTSGTATVGGSGATSFALNGFNPASSSTASTTSDYSSSVSVYDSLGTAHVATVYFRKDSATSSEATWNWYVVPQSGDSITSGGSGTLTFNANGILTSGGTAQPTTFNFAGAQAGQVINLVLGSASGEGATTQYSSSSNTVYQSQDGYPPGVLQSVSVSQDGVISGSYDNGQILKLYQLTLANFNDAQGLEREGGNLYSATLSSGPAYTSAPGEGGMGKINANSLEESNVDLANQFSEMIIAQTGYEANSKVITTTDEILQTLMNMKTT